MDLHLRNKLVKFCDCKFLKFYNWSVAFSYSFSSLSHNRSTPLPKRALHIVRSTASSFRREYPLLSLRSSSSFLRLLPRLPVTSIPPFIFPSITCCRLQFLRKMWQIQVAFRLLISCRIFLCSLTLSSFSWRRNFDTSESRCEISRKILNVVLETGREKYPTWNTKTEG
jgi:hypothetical protein